MTWATGRASLGAIPDAGEVLEPMLARSANSVKGLCTFPSGGSTTSSRARPFLPFFRRLLPDCYCGAARSA